MDEIRIGDGATYHIGSDRYPYTVVGILTSKRLQVRRDNAVRTDNKGLSEIQSWDYYPDDNAVIEVITLRKNGLWYNLGKSSKNSGFFTACEPEAPTCVSKFALCRERAKRTTKQSKPL